MDPRLEVNEVLACGYRHILEINVIRRGAHLGRSAVVDRKPERCRREAIAADIVSLYPQGRCSGCPAQGAGDGDIRGEGCLCINCSGEHGEYEKGKAAAPRRLAKRTIFLLNRQHVLLLRGFMFTLRFA
jgi:hypothetical protein